MRATKRGRYACVATAQKQGRRERTNERGRAREKSRGDYATGVKLDEDAPVEEAKAQNPAGLPRGRNSPREGLEAKEKRKA